MPHPEHQGTVKHDQAGRSRTHPCPQDRSRVTRMSHQKQSKRRASTWRVVRAKAVMEGRLNEEALAAHKRRMLAEMHAHAERQQDDEDGDA